MAIDVHIHVGHRFEWTDMAKALWMDKGPYVPKIFFDDGRQNPTLYLDPLKREGVVGGILIPEYSPLTAGVMPVERAVEIKRFFPEFPFLANLNPNYHGDLVREFERQLSLGAVGLKIHSVHGFFMPNDRRLYPVYEICKEKNLPVFFHAGTSVFPGSRLRYADPYAFDDVANDFPGMIIILCHGGRGFWYHIAEFMVRRFDHVYIDISGLPPKNLLRYYPSMKKLSEKFIFGSDYPGVPGISKNIQVLESLLNDDTAFERIVFKNAYELFGFWREGIFYEPLLDELKDIFNIPDILASLRFYSYRENMRPLGLVGIRLEKGCTSVEFISASKEDIYKKLLLFIEDLGKGGRITFKDFPFLSQLLSKLGYRRGGDGAFYKELSSKD